MSEADKLKALCKAVRAISPGFEVRFTASSDNPDHWCVTIGATHAIIIHTDFGMLDNVISIALGKLANISQKTLRAIKDSSDSGDDGK
jgi:hypothetical protein